MDNRYSLNRKSDEQLKQICRQHEDLLKEIYRELRQRALRSSEHENKQQETN